MREIGSQCVFYRVATIFFWLSSRKLNRSNYFALQYILLYTSLFTTDVSRLSQRRTKVGDTNGPPGRILKKPAKSEAEQTHQNMEKQLQETHTGAAGGAERPETGAEEKTPGHQPPRPESRTSRGSARRAASQVSCGSAVSRVSAEAQLTARLKNLRVRQLERKLEMERQEEQERHEKEDELKRQEDELKR